MRDYVESVDSLETRRRHVRRHATTDLKRKVSVSHSSHSRVPGSGARAAAGAPGRARPAASQLSSPLRLCTLAICPPPQLRAVAVSFLSYLTCVIFHWLPRFIYSILLLTHESRSTRRLHPCTRRGLTRRHAHVGQSTLPRTRHVSDDSARRIQMH